MIDRTTLDLRLAEHRATTARIAARAWQQEGATHPRPLRARLAAARAALAARLLRAARPATHAASPQPGRGTA